MQHKVILFFLFGISSSAHSVGHTNAMFKAVKENDEEALIWAVRNASINARDSHNNNWTAVHYAASLGNSKLIRILFGAKADIDLPDDHGMTPLLIAAHEGHSAEIETLLNLGADKDSINLYGQNAEMLAKLSGDKHSIEIIKNYVSAPKDTADSNKELEFKLSNHRPKHFSLEEKNNDLIEPKAKKVHRSNSSAHTTVLVATAIAAIIGFKIGSNK
jgi:ankyrin repeat protein